MTTPVQIQFWMRTPMVVPSVDKSLDALLSWAAVQEADFNGRFDPLEAQLDTGLSKHTCGDQWCFMASNLDYTWVGDPSQLHYITRSHVGDYADAWDRGILAKRPYFDGARGETKAGSYLQPTRMAESISGYAIVDDMDRVEQLLNWVTHIGKLRHKDHGAVQRFEVRADPLATERWHRRNLPLKSSFATGHPTAIGALFAPYWKRENHQLVAISHD